MPKNKPIVGDLPNTRVLANGAVYDMDAKRIVSAENTTTKFTSANAAEMQARAVAKKRLVMAEAANSDVRPDLVAKYGDYAHVAERAITLQQIATTPEAGKAAIMAHDALVRDMGMSEKAVEQQPSALPSDDMMQSLARFAADIAIGLQAGPKPDVVDGNVTLIRNDLEGSEE